MATLGRPNDGADGAWRGFVARFFVFFFGSLAVGVGLLVVIDPYDSGRFPALPIVGISDDSQRTANVSLGRDARFNAAIFGNSHGQLLDPERLSQATGLSFAQLTIPGAKAPEQIATLQWFIRHHAHIAAIVIAADDRWCEQVPMPWHEFPFWLYGDSNLTYLAHMLSTRPVTAAYRRIRFALGLRPSSDPRGYDDYEIGVSASHTFVPSPTPDEGLLVSSVAPGERPFPAIDHLAAVLAGLPTDVSVVILLPPRHTSILPVNAGPVTVLRECKARLARLARVAAAPGRGFLDYFVDTPLTRDPGNFDDAEHYRAPVARMIEAEIAQILIGRVSDTR
jgi:hypothetical protein